MRRDEATAWGLEQFCVAVTSLLLAGVILNAFEEAWRDHPAASVAFLLVFLALTVLLQIGYLSSVRRSPYRWGVPRPLIDVAIVFLYSEVVSDWAAGEPVWRWLFGLFAAFLAWDLLKVAERAKGGAYRRGKALRKDLGRTGITLGILAASAVAWLPLDWQGPARDVFLLSLLGLFWLLKGTPLLAWAGEFRAGRRPRNRRPAPASTGTA